MIFEFSKLKIYFLASFCNEDFSSLCSFEWDSSKLNLIFFLQGKQKISGKSGFKFGYLVDKFNF